VLDAGASEAQRCAATAREEVDGDHDSFGRVSQ
jgi:hypothetical protein